MDIHKFIVRSGVEIDKTATLQKLEEFFVQVESARLQIVAQNVEANKEIDSAINSVFQEYPGVNLNKSALVGMVMRRLKPLPKMFSKVEAQVEDYISNSGKFLVPRGKGSFVKRI